MGVTQLSEAQVVFVPFLKNVIIQSRRLCRVCDDFFIFVGLYHYKN